MDLRFARFRVGLGKRWIPFAPMLLPLLARSYWPLYEGPTGMSREPVARLPRAGTAGRAAGPKSAKQAAAVERAKLSSRASIRTGTVCSCLSMLHSARAAATRTMPLGSLSALTKSGTALFESLPKRPSVLAAAHRTLSDSSAITLRNAGTLLTGSGARSANAWAAAHRTSAALSRRASSNAGATSRCLASMLVNAAIEFSRTSAC